MAGWSDCNGKRADVKRAGARRIATAGKRVYNMGVDNSNPYRIMMDVQGTLPEILKMIECPHCHHLNQDAARFCAGCGNALLPTVAPTYIGLQTGQVLHNTYRVLHAIGKGGMGAVYLVEDLGAFGRPRVVKEMLQYYDLTNPQEVQAAYRRFETEGRTLAGLRHPGIPDIIASFSEDGRNYIVMEYVEGSNLLEGLTHEDMQGNLVPGRAATPEDVLRWGIQLCEVLLYLARQTPPLVHHDIKPANIIIDRISGAARLVDFGTAKARLVAQPGGKMGLRQSSIYGTEGYAAPEMYQGESSPASDIYSLAATLYHLLTDDDPRNHPLDFPQIDTLEPSLRAVLRSALQNDPHERPDAQGLKEALQGLQDALTGKTQLPFFFPDGKMARTPAELARLCDDHWTVARDLLYKGDLESWFRRALFRTDLADQAAALVRSQSDQDEGLEAFLHVLNPRLPYPVLQVHPHTLRFGRLLPGNQAQRTLHVRNSTGRGLLKGTITADPPVSWLAFPPQFQGEEDLIITLETGNIPEGTTLTTQLHLGNIRDSQTILVQGQVAFPWFQALGRIVRAAAIGGVVGFLLFYLATTVPLTARSLAGLAGLALLLSLRRLLQSPPAKRNFQRFFGSWLWFNLLLNGAHFAAYIVGEALWGINTSAERMVLTASGLLWGMAIGVRQALSRPGHRLIPRLTMLALFLSIPLYTGWQAYRFFGGSPAVVEAPLALSGTATPSQPTSSGVRSPAATLAITATPSSFYAGDTVMVITEGARLNLRQAPGFQATTITHLEPGTRLTVVNGPQQADGYRWWQLRLPDGTEGWAVETYLKPVQP